MESLNKILILSRQQKHVKVSADSMVVSQHCNRWEEANNTDNMSI